MTQRDGATKVAEALREAPPALDELARARMEKRLLDAARAPKAAKAKRTIHPAVWAGGSVLLAAAAALLIVRVWPPRPVHITIAPPIGEELEVREPSQLNVGHAAVELAADSAVRFESIETRDVRLALTRGAIDVAFHPAVRGAEHLSIDTPSARVEVVGTEFRVEIDGATTRVSVTEGTVRVVPHEPGTVAMLVHAGGTTSVTRSGALAWTGAVDLAPPAPAPIALPGQTATAEETPIDSVAVDATATDPTTAIDPAVIEIVQPPAAPATPRGAATPGTPIAQTAIAPAVAPSVETVPAATDQEAAALEVELRAQDALEPAAPVEAPQPVDVPAAVLMSRAESAFARHDYAAGRRHAHDVVRRRQDAPLAMVVEAQTLIGDSYVGEGDVERAISAYRLAARLGRRRADGANAILALARLYEQHGRHAEARQTYIEYLAHGRGGNVRQAIRYLCQHDPPGDIDCSGVRP